MIADVLVRLVSHFGLDPRAALAYLTPDLSLFSDLTSSVQIP
jgi:hypothetical protein